MGGGERRWAEEDDLGARLIDARHESAKVMDGHGRGRSGEMSHLGARLIDARHESEEESVGHRACGERAGGADLAGETESGNEDGLADTWRAEEMGGDGGECG